MSKEKKCGAPAMVRYTWPGKDESFACAICALKLGNVAQAIGLHLQMINLSQNEMLSGLTCLQKEDK